MNIAIVGIDGNEELLGAAMLYLDTLSPEHRVYTLDVGEFHQQVVDECKDQKREVVVMKSDTRMYGIQANLKRDVALAREVDKVMAYWDYRDGDIGLVLTMARLYGKVIHVNPHENGGILSNRPKGVVAELANAGASNVPTTEGSTPSGPTSYDGEVLDKSVRNGGPKVTPGICGFDDDCGGV